MVGSPADGLRNMYELIAALPDQLEASAGLDGLSEIQPLAAGPRRLVLCGMGGSAIAGDLVQPLLQEGTVSLTVWRDYGLPHWVLPEDLVLCCSYSGNTEESLSAARLAGERGCQRVALTSGGELAELAFRQHFPVVRIPGGLPPRASLGYGLGALVRVLDGLGILASSGGLIHGATTLLREQDALRRAVGSGADTPAEDSEGNISPAALAGVIQERIPVIYTAGGEVHGVGCRWKAQINENSKRPACVAQFPELNHNDLVGWSLNDEQKDQFVLIILRGLDDNDRVARRVEVTRELLWHEFSDIHEIRSTAKTALERVLSLVQYGDYLSCHLARLSGVDPVPVDRITQLKNELA